MDLKINNPVLCRIMGRVLDNKPACCPICSSQCKYWRRARVKIDRSPYTREELAGFSRLNEALTELSCSIRNKVKKHYPVMKKRLDNEDTFLHDHEIYIEIGFILRESDPEYAKFEGDPCYYMRSKHGAEFVHRNHYCDGDDWSEYFGPLGLGQKNCYMFHELCDDFHDKRVLLRFGEIWTDVKLVIQNFRKI
ncbi:MAG: hypothetical protein PHQ23_10505 [Candidatus Wallbacteria bacterium]|nr:hypothetical protein [Candidatus Wallbacteria bacterium]